MLEPDVLHEVARLGVGLPLPQAFEVVHQELKRRYPGKMADSYRFILNDAGGALGQVAILYASPWEYLIFFGAPIAAGGHSGRYDADVYDFVMEGEMHTFLEGEVTRNVYLPGDRAHLPKGMAKGYRIPDHAWMLEYARGNMVKLFPFGVIAPTLFVTLDWKSAWMQMSDFVKVATKAGFHP